MRVGRRSTHPCDKADDVDLPANARRIHGLNDRSRTADLNDVVDIASVRELEHLLVPIWCLLVVDDVRGPQLLCDLELLIRRRRCNHGGPGRNSELEPEDGDTARALYEDRVTSLQRERAQECIVRGKCCTGERRCLLIAEVLGDADERLRGINVW